MIETPNLRISRGLLPEKCWECQKEDITKSHGGLNVVISAAEEKNPQNA